ncbi:SMP-30/gluconolactonase/LRE family protein [Gorillibacterium sp. sgz500922]|uniref:SMP-30/gluconolactonase/LRE family protein n=1 Tax=Gorillibacterium sp. sgz500922 TaxID=3446694 RepID=UPI003F66CCB8
MTGRELELVADVKAVLGEGPSWDAERELLYWVDIEGERVHEFNPADGTDRTIPVGRMVGAAVPVEQGGLLLAAKDGFCKLDPLTGRLAEVAKPEAEPEDNRFNDGKCDPAGRFWAGTMSLNGQQKRGKLYRLDADGSVHSILDGFTTSNGLAWTADGRTMYHIDTPTLLVMAYTFDPDTGEVSQPRAAVRFPEEEGFPDGMTIDAEGMLWVAHWGGGKVSRFDPATGERLAEIAVPAEQVTSCAFGGRELDELYITTARTGLSEEQLKRQPAAGGLFRIKPGVKGTPTVRFREAAAE